MLFVKVLFNCFFILLLSLNGCVCSPPAVRNVRDDIGNKEIVGQATNILTVKLLKGGIENNKNNVFSPIGFASILAILSEGARDETNNDIVTVLKHPENRAQVRASYKSVLHHLQSYDPHVIPQFRSWFYIYKNNTVDEAFKKLIADDYFVTVKEIEPYVPDQIKIDDVEHVSTAKPIPSAAIEEKIERESPKSDDELLKNVTPTATNNSKDIVEFDSFKLESDPLDETRIDGQKDASKFDEVVEDRQYVEVPIIKGEMKQSELEQAADAVGKNENWLELAAEKQSSDDVIIEADVKEVKDPKPIDEPQKLTLPLKHFEEMEIMQAEESRLGKAFGGKHSDGASIISGNSIVGEKENRKDDDPDKYEPKMLLFNGLYYRGNWATPFQHLRDENVENVFYTSEDEKVPIKVMKSCGFYRIGDIKKLDSEAIELPYDNERYSMLIVVPKTYGGLKNLINDLSANNLNDITADLQEEFIEVSLPKFEVESTSGAEKILSKEGLASLFTSKADFSGITRTQKLRVGELQQHVTLRVDEGSSTENFLTATNVSRSNARVERTLVVNRPFLFFVRDRIDGVIIVAGKITSLDGFEMHEPEIPK